ncbi:MAG: tetratricopeptide repeat protein, partial [Bacteroidales bacterium]
MDYRNNHYNKASSQHYSPKVEITNKSYINGASDFNKAIELYPDFAEALFNRGLVYLYLGQSQKGIADLSKAGELGIISAYN